MGAGLQRLIVRATLAVKEAGSTDAFVALTDKLVHSAMAQPGTLQYEVFFDATYRHAVFFEQYVDDSAFLARRSDMRPEWRKDLHDLASVTSFEVYGDPGDEVTSLLGNAQFFRYRSEGLAASVDHE